MNIKRIIACALATALALTMVCVFASCGNGNKPAEETVTEKGDNLKPDGGSGEIGDYYETDEVIYPEIPVE